MARMTRGEQQAATRRDLLTVAARRFLADGYAATSLEAIAEEAGYSKGAVYSNFADKPTLCREVLERLHAEKMAEIAEILNVDSVVDERLTQLGGWVERTVGDVGWTMLEMEFAVVSRNIPGANQLIASLHDGMRNSIIAGLATICTDLGVDPGAIDLGALADRILSTAFGLGVRRAVDPAVSVAPLLQVMADIVGVLADGSVMSEPQGTR